jgi:hypothetical protein
MMMDSKRISGEDVKEVLITVFEKQCLVTR